MSGLRRKDLPFAAISLGFSAAAVELLWPVISHTSNVPWLIALLATLALVAPCYHVLRVFTNSVLAPWSPHQRAMLVLGSTGFAALLLLAWPLSPLPSGKHTVSVTNLGARDPSGRGAEVWVEKFSPSDTAPASLEGWTWSSSWRMSGGELVSVDATSQAAKWEGLTDGTAVLTLTRHPWSGGAAISWDGAPPTVVNLYSPVTYRIRIHQPPPFFPHTT